MIWKEKLIVPATRSDLLGFFQKLQAMRNKCAHPGKHGLLLPKDELASFVISALKMRNSLSEAMNTHGANVEKIYASELADFFAHEDEENA